MNYYELLEVNPNASAEVIKNAYKTLAKKFHPDTYDGDRVFAEEKMKLLNEAISVLENEEKRKAYNEENNIGTYYNSYSTVFSSPDLSDTFMEDIDNFLSKKTKTVKKDNKENTVKKAKKKIIIEEEPDDDYEDINANITDSDDTETLTGTETGSTAVYAQSKYDDDIQESLKKVGYYDEDEDEDDDEDDEYEDDDYDEDDDEGYRSRKKNKVKVGKWYWIAISALAVGIIIVGILIFQAFNLDNIRGLFPNSPLNSGVNNIHDDSDDEEHGGEIIPEAGDDEIATEPVLEMPDGALALPVAADAASPQSAGLPAAASTEATTQPPTSPPTQALTQAPTPPPIAQRPAPRPTAAPPTQPPTPAPTEPTTSEEESPTEEITVGEEQEITDGTDGLIKSETETEDTAGNDTTPDESESQAEENIGSEEMPEESLPEAPVIVEPENEMDIPEH